MIRSKGLLIAALAFSFSAHAQVFKCKGDDGKTQLSDRPCMGAVQTEIVKDRGSYVSPEDQMAARQRTAQMQGEIYQKEQEKAQAAAAYNAEVKRQEAIDARKAETAKASAAESDAISSCIRDVERRGASQNAKAELISACRTSGVAQRSSGTTSDAVRECVRNVERTGASEKVKSRELARCHGADVQPEPPPPPKPKALFCQQIGNMLHCN